jgi:DNA-binding IclR family transcriptional regulator
MKKARAKAPRASGAQTLDRGLAILELLAHRGDWLPLRELATETGIHRSAIFRLLRVLMDRRLVARDPRGGGYRLDVGVTDLARGVVPGLGALARPLLIRLAEASAATAFLTLADGDEAVATTVVEPSRTAFHVAYREGFRHRLDRGAPGIAILAGRAPLAGEAGAIGDARRRGYAVTTGELQRGAIGIAAPVSIRGRICESSVGVVMLGDLEERRMAALVKAAAGTLAENVARAGERPGRRPLAARNTKFDRSVEDAPDGRRNAPPPLPVVGERPRRSRE